MRPRQVLLVLIEVALLIQGLGISMALIHYEIGAQKNIWFLYLVLTISITTGVVQYIATWTLNDTALVIGIILQFLHLILLFVAFVVASILQGPTQMTLFTFQWFCLWLAIFISSVVMGIKYFRFKENPDFVRTNIHLTQALDEANRLSFQDKLKTEMAVRAQ